MLFLDCESLIRKMLVVDPGKRYSIENIKKHRWMQAEIPKLPDSTNIGTTHELNDQILRLMQSLGIDSVKTREVPINFFYSFPRSDSS